MLTTAQQFTRVLQALHDAGYVVSRAEGVPGLYHINNGPEITTNQVIGFARSKGLV